MSFTIEDFGAGWTVTGPIGRSAPPPPTGPTTPPCPSVYGCVCPCAGAYEASLGDIPFSYETF